MISSQASVFGICFGKQLKRKEQGVCPLGGDNTKLRARKQKEAGQKDVKLMCNDVQDVQRLFRSGGNCLHIAQINKLCAFSFYISVSIIY
jgi:hypothetical protein